MRATKYWFTIFDSFDWGCKQNKFTILYNIPYACQDNVPAGILPRASPAHYFAIATTDISLIIALPCLAIAY